MWILLLVLAAVIPFLTPTLDLKILSWFYHPGAQYPWPHELDRLYRVLYTFGTWPAMITALTGLALVVAARYRPSLVRWRRHAALLFLTLVIGPGFFVNTVFKDHWGRPRPRQVIELGGRMDYQCFYEKGVSGRGKSFPCGHSSMGYYFVVLYFLARRRKKALALLALAGAAAYGTLIGIARMAAGGHFASDVLWSAVFPCLTAWVLYYFILKIPFHEDNPACSSGVSLWRTKWLLWLAPPLAGAAIAAGLFGTPAFSEIEYNMTIPAGGKPLVELYAAEPGKPYPGFCFIQFITSQTNPDRITIMGEVQGFGWPWSRIRHSAVWIQTNGISVLRFTCAPKGSFSELEGKITVEVPPGTDVRRLLPQGK